MSLFNFGKKKDSVECSCKCGCSLPETEIENKSDNGEKKENVCCIKVLGSGCKNCHNLLENTKEAVNNMGISAEVEYVTDMPKIMEYGVMSLPALAVNEKVVSMRKVLKSTDIEKLLNKLGF